ncbi:hypothetical protein E2C01_002028 [Portunus trituberculatus]|uniref:Secreted protein n=1 Tax=Portunus trituberculatus TaxID=210409 RepID=A0A5B7CLY5_PORTR|nr:hypothetical protein [Portunus trituberculatus]
MTWISVEHCVSIILLVAASSSPPQGPYRRRAPIIIPHTITLARSCPATAPTNPTPADTRQVEITLEISYKPKLRNKKVHR